MIGKVVLAVVLVYSFERNICCLVKIWKVLVTYTDYVLLASDTSD